MNRIGIDLGGTKIEGILLNPNGEEISQKRIPTLREEGYDSILKRMVSLIDSMRAASNTDVSIGVCTPGAISPVTGVMKNSNTQCLIGKPLKDDLEDGISKHWWYRNSAPEKVGINGEIRFITMNGDILHEFKPDFGQELQLDFHVGNLP